MKPQETKAEFIRLRAEGKSYSFIADALHISKATCTSWEREMKDTIAELKQEQLSELYSSYYMTKEARIKKLGDTLEQINTALDGVDLATVAPEKLLDFKLKYMDVLKGEYTGDGKPYQFSDIVEPKDIVAALGNLLERVRAGEVTTEQAGRESSILAQLLKAYDVVEVKTKLNELEAIMEGRK